MTNAGDGGAETQRAGGAGAEAGAPPPNSIAAMVPELTAWRRDFHAHPELGYAETRTAGLVAERLRAFGFDAVETGIGGTGVVGVLHGAGGPGAAQTRRILLRADMDALPIAETSGAPHASTQPGVMHACGHDGHTTMLLGAAKHLAETRAFEGTVYFCFQPAEEEGAGADAMIRDGLFERFDAGRVFGMHNAPGVPVGHFATRAGPVMAAGDEFTILLTGRGGHAANPETTRDPIVAGAQLVTMLQTLVSRSVSPAAAAVVSVTQFHGGDTHNVTPETARLGGTVRSFDTRVHEALYAGMERMIAAVAASFEMAGTLTRSEICYPPTVNDPEAAAFTIGALREIVGPARVHTEFPPPMSAEDFAYMAEARPGCFVFCGNGDSAGLHSPHYDFNDDALAHGVAFWAGLVQAALPRS